MENRRRGNFVTILCLAVSIIVSNVVLIGADKVETPDDVLSILKPDADINLCNLLPSLPRCDNLTSLFDDDVQLALQNAVMKIDAGFDWCQHWPFNLLPFCKRTSDATPVTQTTTTSISSTKFTSATTSNVTSRPNMTTTARLTTHAHVNQTTTRSHSNMTTSAPHTNVTTVPWTEPHSNKTTSSPKHTSTTTTPPTTRARKTTGAHHTTSSPPHDDPFSYKWFFVGFATMLAIILVLIVLVIIIKKVRHARGAAQEPGYSPL